MHHIAILTHDNVRRYPPGLFARQDELGPNVLVGRLHLVWRLVDPREMS